MSSTFRHNEENYLRRLNNPAKFHEDQRLEKLNNPVGSKQEIFLDQLNYPGLYKSENKRKNDSNTGITIPFLIACGFTILIVFKLFQLLEALIH